MRATWPLLALLTLVCHATLAWPNAAPPWQSGDTSGEPNGLRDVAIERETLTIDLRPLADGGSAIIEAVYRLHNRGAAVNTDLVFISGSPLGSDNGVWLDDQPVPSRKAEAPKEPAAWLPPKTTPGVGDRTTPLSYYADGTPQESLFFALTLSPGSHTLRVRYLTRVTAYSLDAPTRYWQFAYVLAPAREWGGFGGLDVTVHVPPGWHAAAEPSLQRDGDRLAGSFDSLPADHLALTTQMPWKDNRGAWDGVWRGVALGGLVVCPLLGLFAGRRLGQAGRSSAWAWLVSLTVALFWAALLALLTMIGEGVETPPLSQASWNTGPIGVLRFVGGMGVAVLALPVGIVLTQVTAWLACSAVRPATV